MPELLNFAFYAVVIAAFAVVLLGLGSRRSQRRPRVAQTATMAELRPGDEVASPALKGEVESTGELEVASPQ
jgi:hypothetical protein